MKKLKYTPKLIIANKNNKYKNTENTENVKKSLKAYGHRPTPRRRDIRMSTSIWRQHVASILALQA